MGSVSTKRELRREVRERRAAMTPTQRAAASRALTERLIAVVRDHGARSISCFLSTPDEPDTSGLIEWAVEQGVEVLLPVSTRRDGEPHLAWARWTDAGAEPGAHGLLEPLGERLAETAVGEVDLMLIPACAVDRRGMRLGWGSATTIAASRPSIRLPRMRPHSIGADHRSTRWCSTATCCPRCPPTPTTPQSTATSRLQVSLSETHSFYRDALVFA